MWWRGRRASSDGAGATDGGMSTEISHGQDPPPYRMMLHERSLEGAAPLSMAGGAPPTTGRAQSRGAKGALA